MAREEHQKFVQDLLKMSAEKRETKPQSRCENIDASEIQRITEGIKEGLQKKRK